MTSPGHDDRLVTGPFVAVTLTTFVFFTYIGICIVAVPRFIEEQLGLGEFGIGVAVATFSIAAIAARPILGNITDRFGRRAAMVGGAALAGVAIIVTGLATSLWHVLVLRALMGVGEAALFIAAATLVADLAPPRRRAEAASYFSVAVYGGIGLGPSLGEWLIGDDRFTLTFLVAGAVALLSALMVSGIPASIDRSTAVGPGTRFFHRAALWPGVTMMSGMIGFAAYTAFLPDYSREVGLAGAAGLFLVYSAVSLVLRITAARLPERLGERTMVTVALVSITAALLVVTIGEPWALWVGAATMGFGMAFMYPSLMANVVNRVDDGERAFAVASFSMFFEAGTVVGGVALGAIAQLADKPTSFVVGAACSAFGLAVLWTRVVPSDRTRTPNPALDVAH